MKANVWLSAGEVIVAVGGSSYVYASDDDVALVPTSDVTVTSSVPVPTGAIAVIWVSLSTVKFVAGVAPKSTAVAFVKYLPAIVTNVSPAAGPADGLTPVTEGDGR